VTLLTLVPNVFMKAQAMMNYKEIITANLTTLSESTVVSLELASRALEKGLVTKEEYEILTAPEVKYLRHYLIIDL